MERILITGGSGLVGTAIKAISKNHNYEFKFLSSKECDLRDYEQTNKVFETYKPNYVIHLAANVGGLYKNMRQRVSMYEDNVQIDSNVLKCCHKYNVKKVVSTLSTCIFPDKTTYPINESMLHDGPPHQSNFTYAYAKRMLEVQCRAYREQYGSCFVCVIPTNIYGINDNFSLEDGHVIPALIHKCYLAKQENKPFVIKGSGSALRQFMYSEDIARLMMWVLEDYNDDSIILSVSESDEVPISRIVELIAENMKYTNIEYDKTCSDGQYKKTADNSKLMQYNSNFEFTSMEDGLKKTVEWFLENYEIARK